MGRKSDNFKLRIRLVVLLFVVLGGLLACRLFFIQVRGHEYYSVRAERQLSSYKPRLSVSIRGDIYFKERDSTLISAATVKDGFLVAVNPLLINDSIFVCDSIEQLIQIDKKDCVEKAGKQGDPFEVIAHRLDSSSAEKIRQLQIKGVDVFSEQWRFYPGGSLASQVLGFVGYRGDELVGRYGIEQYYEDVLKGKKEELEKSESFAMLFFELSKDFLGDDASSGYDVVLTVEPRVQAFLENSLDEMMEDWRAVSAGGLVINPKTGAIIALANQPDFDPNNYNLVEDISYFLNPLVSSIFEVGSVFKPLTLAAGLDTGKISSDTTYIDKGYEIFNNRRIENYDGKARGMVDMQAVLNESLNTGAMFVMQQLGKSEFLRYMKKYGLDEKTGVDLPGETKGLLSNLLTLRDIEYATASFGQGIAVTPLEFSMAASALANGGILLKPYLVDQVIVEGGKDHITELIEKERVLKEETSREITRMLVRVVDEALLGGTVKMDHYSIAAKTGTALLPKKGELGYYEDDYLHSFFGYAPAFDAEFLVFLYLEKPQGVKYASQTLTQPFVDIMKFLLNYYEIPPDR